MINRIVESKPTPESAAFIAKHMKTSDVAEIHAFGVGMHPDLAGEWAELPDTSVFSIDGVPVAIGGVHDGRIWMVSTDEIYKHPLRVHRFAKKIIGEWVSERGVLYNFVWMQNQKTIAWLQSMGARFEAKIYRFSPEGGAFVRFEVG